MIEIKITRPAGNFTVLLTHAHSVFRLWLDSENKGCEDRLKNLLDVSHPKDIDFEAVIELQHDKQMLEDMEEGYKSLNFPPYPKNIRVVSNGFILEITKNIN